jgi:hypothetical protein
MDLVEVVDLQVVIGHGVMVFSTDTKKQQI